MSAHGWVVAIRVAAAIAVAAGPAAAAAAVDLAAMWDFAHPDRSEARFRAALADARGDDALILVTQIARTHGLRGDFAEARRQLAQVAPQLAGAGAEARCRHALETGRSWASPAHPPEALTDAARETARAAYREALAIARAAALDALAVDALHMLAIIATAPDDALALNHEALGLAERSAQPAAQRWRASLRNNLGVALHGLGRYPEALAEFEAALALRERQGDAASVRVARWMVGWTLRALGRIDAALALQRALEDEWAAAGEPDPDVFDELEQLYRLQGDTARADAYAAKKKMALEPPR